MSFDSGEHDYTEEESTRHPRVRYLGEDSSPTTTRELNGWFAYPIAAEVFAVVAVGAFLPVVLEQLARENGVFFSDRSKSCVDHVPGSGQAGRALQIRGEQKKESEQCMVLFLGKEMSTSSFAMYTFSAAVLIQAVMLVCFSSFADHGPYRKKMLMTFAYLGSIASALFIFITPAVYYLAPVLVILGVTSLGFSFVLLNAFLPLLVANHPDDSHAKPLSSDSSSDLELETLNPQDSHTGAHGFGPDKLTRDLERSALISSKGVGYGYIAAVLVQVLSILVLYLFSKTEIQKKSPSLPIRVILFLVGIWWAIFTIPTILWLRPRPGAPLPTRQTTFRNASSSRIRTFMFYTSFSLRSFWSTLQKAVRLRQTLLFLMSWFLLSDAVATISGTAILFARTELHMGTIAIALLSITSIGSGIVGAFAWPRVQQYFALQPKAVLLCCIAGMEIIPLYGLLGYIPLFKSLGFIGLQRAWEIYPIAVLHGIVMGGISSYARSVYAPLIPEGSEAAFFALYAVTDKGSSAFGPALVGWIVDRAGTIRPAFLFLAVLVVLPAPLLWWLDVERGREDARAMAEGDGKGSGAYERVNQE
ncbi:autophagy-related protein 22-1 [Cucurbitaria berberidis CBS 394.84]|uniref:Autophagy-related protein n=1 Tax=Cucurbitaria berberidis CBS 394.84 TaxID=1168544 RepID=A0A9P4GLC4_9PLEO|nr:autophagy-related protein 22-1 [Cucurbitaria berberidis CBS 394.84]KAF1847772.1 autophagy-related protein 22-1 [Cucurbitaria berberidis CBS 394.84]